MLILFTMKRDKEQHTLSSIYFFLKNKTRSVNYDVFDIDASQDVKKIQRRITMKENLEDNMEELLEDMGFETEEEQARIHRIIDEVRLEDDEDDAIEWAEWEQEDEEEFEDEEAILDELQAIRDGEGMRFKDNQSFLAWIQAQDDEA